MSRPRARKSCTRGWCPSGSWSGATTSFGREPRGRCATSTSRAGPISSTRAIGAFVPPLCRLLFGTRGTTTVCPVFSFYRVIPCACSHVPSVLHALRAWRCESGGFPSPRFSPLEMPCQFLRPSIDVLYHLKSDFVAFFLVLCFVRRRQGGGDTSALLGEGRRESRAGHHWKGSDRHVVGEEPTQMQRKREGDSERPISILVVNLAPLLRCLERSASHLRRSLSRLSSPYMVLFAVSRKFWWNIDAGLRLQPLGAPSLQHMLANNSLLHGTWSTQAATFP